MYFACRVQKHRFLRCFGPFGGHGFYLGDVQKPWFLRGFELQGGEKIGKVGILKVFQHSRNIDGQKNGRDSANIGRQDGPTWGQHGANIGQHRGNIGQHRANIGPRQGQHGAKIGPT